MIENDKFSSFNLDPNSDPSPEERKYNLYGKQVKPNVLKFDINDEMRARAYDLAFESLEKFSVERDMADYIKNKFDQEFIPSWHCVVGK